ncbi:MAG: beta-ketoacyl-ACP synthase III [Coprococcus sp.]
MRGKICGTGSYVPEHYLDNHDIAGIVETSDEWIRERTGIVRRHIADNDTTVSMAIKAGQAALENGQVEAQELDMILVSTITPNTIIPCTACEVQKALGADRATCFDLSAACSGFVFAYNTAQAYIAAGICKTVLLIGSETLSTIVDWQDRGSCILFGDGAGAAVLRAEEGECYPWVTHSDGAKGEVLSCESRNQRNWKEKEQERKTYTYMDGQAVFKFAVKRVPEVVRELLQKTELSVDDIDWFVLHQANQRIIESIARRMKTDISKFPMNIAEYGNTSSSSIPILLDEMNRKGQLRPGQKIVLAGYGAGLSWGAALLEWA